MMYSLNMEEYLGRIIWNADGSRHLLFSEFLVYLLLNSNIPTD